MMYVPICKKAETDFGNFDLKKNLLANLKKKFKSRLGLSNG